MKELEKERGGTIALDEKNNRLFLIMSDANVDTYKKIVNRLNDITQEYKIKELLIDTSNREGSDQALKDYSVEKFRDILNQGLERIAIVLSSDQKEVDLTHEFVSELGNDAVQTFSNKQEAINWLNRTGGQQRKAA